MSTLCVFDIDGTLFPNQLIGECLEFDNDFSTLDRLPLKIVRLPNFVWLTGWLWRAPALWDAAFLFADSMNPMEPMSQDTIDGVWWKKLALAQFLTNNPNIDRVIWADDEQADFTHDVLDLQQEFSNVEFLLICPRWQDGMTETDWKSIQLFLDHDKDDENVDF